MIAARSEDRETDARLKEDAEDAPAENPAEREELQQLRETVSLIRESEEKKEKFRVPSQFRLTEAESLWSYSALHRQPVT
ncbi:hypothetical protein cypCar_00037134 [Cyprinus carpio]|nr:hypothetical protein cypCar_00037134 [Cyprinus carpio]